MTKRQIKFRAWDPIKKIIYFVHGYLWEEWGNNERDLQVGMPEDDILMQFTGLFDKNGKEIYEGDVVKISDKRMLDDSAAENHRVLFDHRAPCCGFGLSTCLIGNYQMPFGRIMKDVDDDWDVVVIGNIYENPILLK